MMSPLNLSTNKFNGSLPASIGSLPSTQKLILGNKRLQGIPREVGRLKRPLKLNTILHPLAEEVGRRQPRDTRMTCNVT